MPSDGPVVVLHKHNFMEFPIRLNKYLAHQGVASRREADTLIEKGQVTVNGKKAVVGQKITEADKVEVTGKTKEKKYLAYYKGRGIITHSPDSHETDIATRLLNDYGMSDVYPVGRLDKDSEGLLILTNDGRITGPLLDPAATHEKEYDVMVDKKITGILTNNITKGVSIEGYQTKPAKAVKSEKNPQRLSITLTEGKKHQIRRMCAALGYQVQSLKRVRVMNIELGTLKPNQFRKLNKDELKVFLKELGL